MRLHDAAVRVIFTVLLLGLSALGSTAARAPGLTSDENAFFQDGAARFASVHGVSNGGNNGLGPRSNSCVSCHLQPFAGGTSPAANPLPAVVAGSANTVPWFS